MNHIVTMVGTKSNTEETMKKTGILLSSLMFLATLLAIPLPAFAASNAIGVNPHRNYIIKPGGKVNDTVTISNLSKKDALTVNISVIDFKAQDETGTPSLMINSNQSTTWSLKPYLTIPSQETIPAGGSVDVPLTITMPKDIGAGSYYSAIRYSAINSQTGKNLNVASSAVTLVFAQVPGSTHSNLSLLQFGTFTPNSNLTSGEFGSFYSASKPQYVSFRLRNNGNVAEQPEGSILVRDIFGHQVKLIQNVNPNGDLILIGQTRRYDVCLNEKDTTTTTSNATIATCDPPSLMPGYYKASMDVVYGNGTRGSASHEIKDTAGFWYLPVWFIIALVVVILLVVGVIWSIVQAVKRRGGNKFSTRR